jgi:hypothetical protein
MLRYESHQQSTINKRGKLEQRERVFWSTPFPLLSTTHKHIPCNSSHSNREKKFKQRKLPNRVNFHERNAIGRSYTAFNLLVGNISPGAKNIV